MTSEFDYDKHKARAALLASGERSQWLPSQGGRGRKRTGEEAALEYAQAAYEQGLANEALLLRLLGR